jgi:hypothetical protein
MKTGAILLLTCLGGVIGAPGSLLAQQAAGDSLIDPRHALAIRLRNHVPDMVIVPLENDLEFGTGAWNATRNTLTIEPVIPIPFADKRWRVVTRTLIPFVYEDPGGENKPGKSGVGDINLSLFLASDYQMNGWTVGLGPVLNLPTAGDSLFGYRKWAAGPTAVVVKQAGGLTAGLLLNHQWSFGGPGPYDVSASLVDPWVSYTWKHGFSVDLEAQSTYDWYAKKWTIPLRYGVGQVVYLGPLPISLELDGLQYFSRGAGDPHWGLSFTMTLVIREHGGHGSQ